MVSGSPNQATLSDIQFHPSAMCSTDTFDLDYCLAVNSHHFSPLLEVSFSVHSLPSVSSSDTIPRFPDSSLAHKVHVDTYLSLHQPNHLGGFSTSAVDRTNAGIGVLLAAPTAPRLRNMMREPLHIKKWLNGLVRTSTISIRKTSRHDDDPDWKAEGSLYTPDEFAEALQKSRPLRTPMDNKSVKQAKWNRDALVIRKDRDRVSGKIPISSTSPGTTGDMKHVNNFFKADIDPNQGSLPVDFSGPDGSPSTPRLVVSTSDAVFRISLESSSDLSVNAPMTIAARRGKKMLPHLLLRQNHDEVSYPSIPTAFLGTSSEPWPPKHTAYHENTRMDLQFMISTLQSHRVAEPFLSGATDTSCSQKKETGDNDGDSDEWAFADAFVSEYGDLSSGSSGHETTSFNVSSTGITGSDASIIDENESPLFQHTFSEISTFAELSGSSTVPPPQRPTLRTPPQEVRGILKGCKNVRFASLPNRQWSEQQLEQENWSDRSMTRIMPTPVQGTPYAEFKGSRRASTVTSSTFLGRSRLPNPFKPVHNQGHPAVHKADLDNNPISFSSKVRGSAVREISTDGCQRRFAVHHRLSVASKMPAAPENRPHYVSTVKSTGNKENEKRLTMAGRKILGENAGRRDSSVCQPKDALSKKRIQVPLRNILTRFK